MSETDLRSVFLKLLAYCRANRWAGYDPYDGLNSRMFNALPFLNSRIPRLMLTQALKRMPFNARPLLLVPKRQNAKAIALFLSALLSLPEVIVQDQETLVWNMAVWLAALRSPDVPYWCWGYSFPWQTRTIVVPAGAPNLVSTVFVANALLDADKRRRNSACLEMAKSAGEYILEELYWSEDGPVAGFNYPQPGVRNQVHNANLLAAALLCRLARETGEERFLAPALKAARYAASKQREDGSWYYGEAPAQRWIDNFHTGYNLSALRRIAEFGRTAEFDACIRRGFEFYRTHFFREDGAPRYFHNRTYPIDAHAVAQSIITLLEFKDHDPENIARARSVFAWSIKHLWDDRGFFYYRVLRSCTIRTSYMRWSQAWMLLAIAKLLAESAAAVAAPETESSTALA
ncbi:MAG: hypothetical protein ACRD2B_00575 [Terriglobia bacterium]